MTFKKDLADLLKTYGLDTEIVNLNIDQENNAIDIEIPVYNRSGELMMVDNEFLTTFISLPLSAEGPLVQTLEGYKRA